LEKEIAALRDYDPANDRLGVNHVGPTRPMSSWDVCSPPIASELWQRWNLPCSGPLCGCIKPKEAVPNDEDRFRSGSSRSGADDCSVAVSTPPAKAQTLKMAQGVDVQLGRDRDDRDRRRRNDSDVTIGVGPGGVTVGPRQNCRMVTTTVERDDGRTITRKERRCD